MSRWHRLGDIVGRLAIGYVVGRLVAVVIDAIRTERARRRALERLALRAVRAR